MAGTVGNVIHGLDLTALFKVGVAASEVDLGYTQGGVNCRVERDYDFVEVDQEQTVIKSILVMKNAFIGTTFAEAALAVMSEVWDGAAATGGTLLISEAVIGERSVVFVGLPPGASTDRTITMAKARSIDAGQQPYTRDGILVTPAEFRGIGDPANSGLLFKVVDA